MKVINKRAMLVPLCVALLFSLSSCEVPSPDPPPESLLPPLPDPPLPPNGNIDFAREPRYAEQWYLRNTGQQEGMKGIDINIEPVWQKGYGKNPVYVGILDQTIDRTHPDLQANIPPENIITDGFVPYSCDANHGTKVAGLIAARDNGVGIIGVAPRAILYSYGVVDKENTDQRVVHQKVIRALQRDEHKTIAVYNGSIGNSTITYNNTSDNMKEAMQNVTDHGFYGKGSSLVFAAGNWGFGSPSNSSYLNYYAVIVVNGIVKGRTGSTTFITGENIWITAPSELITTDTQQGGCHQKSGYVTDFGGTSAATPLVSGAIALLRSEYPDLTWRDVKLIIAESARKHVNEGQASYRESGRMHSDPNKQQTYHHEMGFGLLDVDAMFSLASSWLLLPSMERFTDHSSKPLAITKNEKYTSELPICESNIQFIESLTIEMDIEKTGEWAQSWLLRLIAPDGKEALVINHTGFRGIIRIPEKITKITFLVSSFLGSSADGTWKLEIEQDEKKTIKKIIRWGITFRGH